MKKQAFSINIELTSKGDSPFIRFSHENHVIGEMPSRYESRVDLYDADQKWHGLLKSDDFNVSESCSSDLAEALRTQSSEYSACTDPQKLTWKFLASTYDANGFFLTNCELSETAH